MHDPWRVPFILRGELIEVDADAAEYETRRQVVFRSPDPSRFAERLCLPSPSALADLHGIDFEEIVAYLARLGSRLDLERNPALAEALELGARTTGLPRSVLRAQYETLPRLFLPEFVRDMTERSVGIGCIEGWTTFRGAAGARSIRVRAFGARCAHVIAGNVPQIAAITIIRNAVTRSDALIKLPSNDLLTAVAIARTMLQMDPHHPLTRHLAVAYWKGGDEEVEDCVYHSRRIEKLIAWGGLSGIRHIVRRLQPGIDLISFEPKVSCAIIGPEVYEDTGAMSRAAARLARDIAALNQEACFSVRTVYVVCGTHEQRLERALQFAARTLSELRKLPPEISGPDERGDVGLQARIDGLRLTDAGCTVVGRGPGTGAILVSHDPEPVEFAGDLRGLVANLVPVADFEEALSWIGMHNQTVALFPERLKAELSDKLALKGVQRIVSLGGVALLYTGATPHDAMEPLRRMCRWVVEEPALVSPAEDSLVEHEGGVSRRPTGEIAIEDVR